MRAVLDCNVIISGALSRAGSPARVIAAWRRGAFELVASPTLIAELERALAHPEVARLIPASDAAALVAWLGEEAEIAPDPPSSPIIRSEDPGDDYLLALSADQRAALVSGDKHLLKLADRLPIYGPAEFLALLPDELTGGP